MVILYLYSELVGYQIPIFFEYTNKYNAKVHVVNWDKNNIKPYAPPEIRNVTYYKRSQFTTKSLTELALEINPDIIYISGWMDRDYLVVAKEFRKKGVPVVAGFDDQWIGTVRQRIASLLSPVIIKKYFSHAWVSGSYQYEFAKKFGFKNNNIIYNLLSCDTKLFCKGKEYLACKAINYPDSFLYVGNFRSVKGTDILVNAFEIYRSKYQGKWKLICVGNGEMRSLLEGVPGVELLDFMNQEGLVEITKRSGVFVLPSRFEKWGVVVHEFTSAAMPLILSEYVGAMPTFFVENYNGISYKNNSSNNLANAMFLMSNKNVAELIDMSNNSHKLSLRVNPEISAASFLSILN